MLNTPIPNGLYEALEPEEEKKEEGEEEKKEEEEGKGNAWWKGKTLDSTSPSWQWKLDRQEKALPEDKNKAGRKRGQSTTSTSRKLRRQMEQPQKNDEYWGKEVVEDYAKKG